MKTLLQKISRFLHDLSHRSVVKELACLALFLLTLFFMVLPVYASTYVYSIPIIVQYNTSVLYNQTVIATINNTQLNSYGYITAGALDTAFGPGLENNPLMVATDRIVGLYTTIPQSQPTQSLYKLGWSPQQDDFYVMTGGGGYVTAADSATLEPAANNWEVEWRGYIDTTTQGYLVGKEDSYGLYCFGNGTVMAFQTNAPESIIALVPSADNGIAITSPAAPHWDDVDDSYASPDDGTTRVYTSSGSYLRDTYNITVPTTWPPGGAVSLDSITTYKRVEFSAVDASHCRSQFVYLLGTSESLGTEHDTTNSWTTYDEVVAKPGGGSWTWSDFSNSTFKIGIQLRESSTSGSNAECTMVGVRLAWTGILGNTTVSTVASGSHTIKASKWGTTLGLYVDDALVGTNATLGGPAYGSSYGLVLGTSSKYAEYVKLNIAGAQKLWWQPTSMVTSAQVPDRSGNSNVGTITWGTNPSGLSVAFASLGSSNSTVPASGSSAVAPAYLPTPGQANITQETMYADPLVTGSLLPGYDGFQRAAASLEWETKDLYALMMMFVALAVAFATIVATGSMMMGAGTMALLVGAGAATGIIDPILGIFIFVVCLVMIGIFRGS